MQPLRRLIATRETVKKEIDKNVNYLVPIVQRYFAMKRDAPTATTSEQIDREVAHLSRNEQKLLEYTIRRTKEMIESNTDLSRYDSEEVLDQITDIVLANIKALNQQLESSYPKNYSRLIQNW